MRVEPTKGDVMMHGHGREFMAGLFLFLLLGCQPGRDDAATQPDATVVQAVNRGVSLMGQYDYDGAVKAFEQALEVQPDLMEAKINLAIALFNRNQKEDQDLDRSGQLLEEVLALDSQNVQARYFKGILLQHIGNAEEAIPCFEYVTTARPGDGAAWYLLGLCKQRLSQSAEVELLKAVELRPYLFSAYYKLAMMSLAAGKTEQGARYMDQFKKLRESPLGEAIELPQYNQMGDLALVRPLQAKAAPPITRSTMRSADSNALFDGEKGNQDRRVAEVEAVSMVNGIASADVNRDGRMDLLSVVDSTASGGRLCLLLQQADGTVVDGTSGSGLETVKGAVACSFGDYDNDGMVDLYVAANGPNALFQGQGDGTFVDVTDATGTSGGAVRSRSAVFLDADHDADLDILVCNGDALDGAGAAANNLFNNNSDGTFTDVAGAAGVALVDSDCQIVLVGDLDQDRDNDLVFLRRGQPALVMQNDLLMSYRAITDSLPNIRGDLGGVLQDLNQDQQLDLMVIGGDPPALQCFFGNGEMGFVPNPAVQGIGPAALSWGPLRGLRCVDIDLDGDLDVALFSSAGHVLLNDGLGQFVLRTEVWPAPSVGSWNAVELLDYNGDFLADLVAGEGGGAGRVVLSRSELDPPSTALAVVPNGVRGRDGRTRSPASGFGVRMTARTGLHEQSLVYTGFSGGPSQSSAALVLGLAGANRLDYLQLHWPDGVSQVEIGLAANQTHEIAEMQRKLSSCPVLFTWNGDSFEFITDFAGVGGLGYFVAPGESAPPQVLEHVKIEPAQLQPRDGAFELRICEPMEETAYVDRLELRAIDHPTGVTVFPDERLSLSGAPPTHRLLVVPDALAPVRAMDPNGTDCLDRLSHVDRVYAYEPKLDRRFIGFCEPHTLELDFGDQLAAVDSDEPLFLFVRGYIEYPYSQTVYAAGQAQVGWEPIRIERRTAEGTWQTIVDDAGVPGGMDRTMTVDLTGLAHGDDCQLRLTTNLEIYYDRVFMGKTLEPQGVRQHVVPLLSANLGRVGFALEYSPDGRLPLIYDYALTEATAPFHVLRGAYTRYGPVEELLAEFDDKYVLVGPGDEIALRFDAASLPTLAEGWCRSYLLVSHAYCKDMDLYTATPNTLEPLPFRGMSAYPYPDIEQYPSTEEYRRWRTEYNTRMVE